MNVEASLHTEHIKKASHAIHKFKFQNEINHHEVIFLDNGKRILVHDEKNVYLIDFTSKKILEKIEIEEKINRIIATKKDIFIFVEGKAYVYTLETLKSKSRINLPGLTSPLLLNDNLILLKNSNSAVVYDIATEAKSQEYTFEEYPKFSVEHEGIVAVSTETKVIILKLDGSKIVDHKVLGESNSAANEKIILLKINKFFFAKIFALLSSGDRLFNILDSNMDSMLRETPIDGSINTDSVVYPLYPFTMFCSTTDVYKKDEDMVSKFVNFKNDLGIEENLSGSQLYYFENNIVTVVLIPKENLNTLTIVELNMDDTTFQSMKQMMFNDDGY